MVDISLGREEISLCQGNLRRFSSNGRHAFVLGHSHLSLSATDRMREAAEIGTHPY